MDEKELEALKASNPKAYDSYIALKTKADEHEKTKKELEELKGKKKEDDPKDDDDIIDKARKTKEANEKNQSNTKDLEGALKFNLSVAEFVKSHKDVLPTEVEDGLKEAEKEKYDSAIEKASATKAGMIKSFFSVQANLDLLTSSHKKQVEDYLKLTKNGREEKAPQIFENVFEPALETMKRVKKAEEVGKASSGYSGGSKHENAYKEKLMAMSQKTHLGKGT